VAQALLPASFSWTAPTPMRHPPAIAIVVR